MKEIQGCVKTTDQMDSCRARPRGRWDGDQAQPNLGMFSREERGREGGSSSPQSIDFLFGCPLANMHMGP